MESQLSLNLKANRVMTVAAESWAISLLEDRGIVEIKESKLSKLEN